MMLAMALFMLAIALAGGADLRPLVGLLAILGRDPDVHLGALLAKIGGVDQEPALAAPHGQGEFRHRDIGNGFKAGADSATNGVNPPIEIDVDLPIQGGDQVGQLIA